MNNLTRIFQAGLLLLAITSMAKAQVAVPFSDGGKGGGGHMGPGAGYYGSYGAQSGAGFAHVPWLGQTMFSLNSAIDGLGYEGSYASAATTIPLGEDALHGWWLLDMRANISEQGLPFTNIGLVRRTHFKPMNADFGIGVFYDMDADEYENFGHTFHQVGVSAHVWTPHFDIDVNGYVPLGPSNRAIGTPGECFYQNYVLAQHGLDAALEGWDINFGIRPPSWQQKSGTVNLGVYSYGSESVDPFAGFQGSYSFMPRPGVRLVFGMTADEEFNSSGLFQLELWRGRSRGYSPSGRGLDPMRRRTHIVRQHSDPIFLTSPDTGDRIRVVHVDNSAPAGGNGRFESPYNELQLADGTLPAFVKVGNTDDIPRSLAGDIIFVHEGLSRNLNGTPLDPTDDLPGNLTGYDTGITLLDGQSLLGDGVRHIIATVEVGNFELCNDQDALTPFISNPNGAAVTLADDTTVRGFEIVNSQVGILADDPTPLQNNGDGVAGDVTIRDVNIVLNNSYNTAGSSVTVPFEYGINILDSTASFDIYDANITGQDVNLPVGAVPADTTVINNLVAALNIEGGSPDVTFDGVIDNTFDMIQTDGQQPPVFTNQGTLSTGGWGVRVANTTGGTITLDGTINNVNGEGILINNADNTEITFNSPIAITDSSVAAVNVMNSDNSIINFGQVTIANSAAGTVQGPGVILRENPGSTFNFVTLNVTTTAGLGFQAINSGTVNMITPAIINATGGAAVDIENTVGQTTGLAGWTFERLTSTNSADEGVRLVGLTEDFLVRGVTNITNNAGTGIDILGGDAVDIDFNEVNITDRQGTAVRVDSVAGTVRFASVDSTGGTGVGNAINIIDTFATGGRVELLGGIISDAQADSVYIENSIATVANMTIDEANGGLTGDGIQVVTTGTGSSVVLLRDNVINLPTGDNGVRLIANGTGTLNATVTNNVLTTQAQAVGETRGGLHATIVSGTLNLSANNNSDGAGGAPTDDFFLEQLGGTFNVTEPSAGDFSSLNNNVNVVPFGAINFNTATPQLPPPILP